MEPYIHILPLPHIGYDLSKYLKPSSATREFFTPNFYRCLPLTAANTLGWTFYNPFPFKAIWKGGVEKDATQVEVADSNSSWATSWFGKGTFTIHPDFLVETSPGIDLLIRPVPNHFKLPVLTLEGIVETDWLKASFTLNFRFMIPMISASYEVGEPLVQLVPYPREFIENFEALIVTEGDEYQKRMQAFSHWGKHRKEQTTSDGHYMRGVDENNVFMNEHKKTFNLNEFSQSSSSKKKPK